MRTTMFKAALLASAAAQAAVAQAQTSPSPADPARTDPAQQAARPVSTLAAGDVADIVVTGSRIITNGNNAPTPVTVLTPESVLVTKPTNIYENLSDLPVFSGSRGAANGPVTSSPNAAGGNQPNGAVSSLNLRNMGPLRTLILFDGKRLPPLSPDGLVDPSTLPQMLIQRVDVVTGGVSAVYGSDGITGAVNFITDTKFTGVKVEAQYGVSQQNDADSWQAGIAAGANLFGGRGHIMGSYQHTDSKPLYERERDWFAPRWGVHGNGTTVPFQLVPYVTNYTATFAGSIACPNNTGFVDPRSCTGASPAGFVPQSFVGLTFKQNGVWSQFTPGTTTGLTNPNVQNGGDGAYFVNVALRSKIRTDQAFGRFDYDILDNVHVYVAGAWNRNFTVGNNGTQRTFVPGVNIGACNAFLPTAYQTQLGCTAANRGTTSEPIFRFEKQFNSYDNFGMGQNNELESTNIYGTAGLDGTIGSRFRWNASYTHSETKLFVSALNQNRQHMYAGLDAVVNPATGQLVCRITLTNPTVLPGCIPLNLFGPTAMTREMAYYIVDEIHNTTKNKQDGATAEVSGSPFNSWAGPVQMGVSGEWRRQTMSLTTDSLANDLLNCSGLRFNNCTPTAGSTFSALPVHPNTWLPVSGVSQTVLEAAAEIDFPLLADMPFFKSLNFNGAARYARYKNDPGNTTFPSTKFNAKTWKLGLTWAMNDAITLRGTISRDFRAPSLYDLYQPITLGNTTNGTDYLISVSGVAAGTGVPSSPRLRSGGNPFLSPEIARTVTLGAVFRPFRNFSLSLDAYRIKLKDALYSLSGLTETVQRACYASGGASPLCQLQERALNSFTDTSSANIMTAYYQRSVNIARLETEGVDAELNWRTSVSSRPLSLRALVTYQPHIYYYVPFGSRHDLAGVAYSQIGGLYPAPVWKVAAFLSFKATDRITIDVSERWRSKLHFSSDPAAPNEIGHTAAVAYTNLTFSYDLPTPGFRSNLFFNIQNLFDKDPPPAGSINPAFPGAFPSVYAVGDDVLGRYFTAGMRFKF